MLPIENPYDDLEATRFEFIQAWGEIMDEYTRAGGKVSVVLPKEYEEAAIDAQMAYLEDDPNIGIIQEWLDTCDKERVCIPMIWKEALKMEYVKPSQKDLNNLHEIMRNNIKGWKYEGKQRIDMIYGTQRCYVPKAEFLDAPRDPFV